MPGLATPSAWFSPLPLLMPRKKQDASTVRMDGHTTLPQRSHYDGMHQVRVHLSVVSGACARKWYGVALPHACLFHGSD